MKPKKDPRIIDQRHLGYYPLAYDEYSCLPEILEYPEATNLDEIPGAEGRFGYDVSNPIPIHGIPNSALYLENLRTAEGARVHYDRVGSIHKDLDAMPIDVYRILDANFVEIARLHLCPYHFKCSEKAPEGFILVYE